MVQFGWRERAKGGGAPRVHPERRNKTNVAGMNLADSWGRLDPPVKS